MAIRNDFTIDWDVSPRVIIVDSPSVECTMQDLLDTLRNEEAKFANMDNPPIVDASGKEPLGGGTKVGITVALQNAVIGFETRSGPDWISCGLTGGNLVAFDTDGISAIVPVYPTAYVSIAKTSSSSATLQEQDALNYASYQNSVWVDPGSGNTGTLYPVGNREHPVNNIQDAVTIANENGFSNLQILNDITLSTGDNVEDFALIGVNTGRTMITIETGADTLNCEISEATIEGVLDGGSQLVDCVINELNYVNGQVHQCMLNGPITLGGGAVAHFTDCYSGIPGLGTPTIDMGGSGQALALRGYNGGIKLTNKTGTDSVSIDLASGQIKLASTITNGTIVCRGVGTITEDFSAGATIVNQMLNIGTITDTVWAYERV
ncbi:MAG: hypothetical protein DRZ90_12835 [Spirochaetes bacterium]|nr:MAG: hypothetical protein DRZ90_12835 [Spirochaetota bacterium]